MPSIASFIKELLSEDQYSDEYNKRLQDRIDVMNAAQLQGKGGYLISNNDCWLSTDTEWWRKE